MAVRGTLRVIRLSAMMAGALILAALCGMPAMAAQPAGGQSASNAAAVAGFAISAKGRLPLHQSVSDLETLPPVEMRVSFLGMHGKETATYTGALLWDVLGRADAYDASMPRSRVATVIYATGRDGYTVALALPEIDPAFEDKRVIVAYRKDGQPLPQGQVRLVVPGDQHGARSVRDVVAISVH